MKPGTKHPYTELLTNGSWTARRSKPTREREIRDWFSRDPNCGVAVITGKASGNLVAVDVDYPEYFSLPVPPSPQVVTPRGFRSFYKVSGTERVRVKKYDWGDLLYGQLAILPPSIHPNGERYTWSDFLTPWQVEIEDLPPAYLPDLGSGSSDTWTRKQVIDIHLLASRSGVSDTASITGDSLRSLYSTEEIVWRVAPVLGISERRLGHSFCCVLPGHQEKNPSASLYRGDNGVIVYHDFHRREGVEFYTLPEVRAAQAYGHAVPLLDRKPELAVWGILLLVEGGVLPLAPVLEVYLPADAPWSARALCEGFRLLLGCRWLYTPGDPAPFSWRFASAWCGVSQKQAGKGIQWLIRNRVLIPAGKHRRTTLFQIGGSDGQCSWSA